MEQIYVQTEDLSVGYHGKVLLSDIALKVKKGEILVLIGPNGAGKSTIIKNIIREMNPIAFGETMDGMPDIRITVSENGYIQINGKRAYPLSLKYAGKRLYVHLLGCLQDGADLQQ